MNKHIQTLISFKNGSKTLAKESFYELWDALDSLVSAGKKIGKVLLVFVCWLFGLLLICLLPLATWLRLKWRREQDEAIKKAKSDYWEKMTCLHQKGDQHE